MMLRMAFTDPGQDPAYRAYQLSHDEVEEVGEDSLVNGGRQQVGDDVPSVSENDGE